MQDLQSKVASIKSGGGGERLPLRSVEAVASECGDIHPQKLRCDNHTTTSPRTRPQHAIGVALGSLRVYIAINSVSA